jgi:hypothetical protein
MGQLTVARHAMFLAAFQSALPANPQERHRKEAWGWRFAFSQCPHIEQVRLVLRGSTRTTATPTAAAL